MLSCGLSRFLTVLQLNRRPSRLLVAHVWEETEERERGFANSTIYSGAWYELGAPEVERAHLRKAFFS